MESTDIYVTDLEAAIQAIKDYVADLYIQGYSAEQINESVQAIIVEDRTKGE